MIRYRELRSNTPHVTPQMIKAKYLGEDEGQMTLTTLFEYHNTHSAHLLSKATISHYKTTQKYLLKYIKQQYKSNDYKLSLLNHAFTFDTIDYIG